MRQNRNGKKKNEVYYRFGMSVQQRARGWRDLLRERVNKGSTTDKIDQMN